MDGARTGPGTGLTLRTQKRYWYRNRFRHRDKQNNKDRKRYWDIRKYREHDHFLNSERYG